MLTSLALATVLTLQPGATARNPINVHAFTMRSIEGAPVELRRFEGQVLLIVNTASRCGYAKQFSGLETLHQKFRGRGFSVLGFPSNTFNQEPGTNAEIQQFCRTNYKVSFPMFAKIDVAKGTAHPLFQHLVNNAPGKRAVDWNFNKFLVDRDGRVISRFASKVGPLDDELVKAIEAALKAPRGTSMSANSGGGPGRLTTKP